MEACPFFVSRRPDQMKLPVLLLWLSGWLRCWLRAPSDVLVSFDLFPFGMTCEQRHPKNSNGEPLPR